MKSIWGEPIAAGAAGAAVLGELWARADRVDAAFADDRRLREFVEADGADGGPQGVRVVTCSPPPRHSPAGWRWTRVRQRPVPEFMLFYAAGCDFPECAVVHAGGPIADGWITVHRRLHPQPPARALRSAHPHRGAAPAHPGVQAAGCGVRRLGSRTDRAVSVRRCDGNRVTDRALPTCAGGASGNLPPRWRQPRRCRDGSVVGRSPAARVRARLRRARPLRRRHRRRLGGAGKDLHRVAAAGANPRPRRTDAGHRARRPQAAVATRGRLPAGGLPANASQLVGADSGR